MKIKWLASIALGLLRINASAQMVIYGLVVTGVGYVTNANAAPYSVLKMPSLTSSYPSRMGSKGTKELSSDLKAGFMLAAGFVTDTGQFRLAATHDIQYGNAGATNGLTNSVFNEKRISLAGYAMFGQTEVGLVQRETHAAADSEANLFFFGAG